MFTWYNQTFKPYTKFKIKSSLEEDLLLVNYRPLSLRSKRKTDQNLEEHIQEQIISSVIKLYFVLSNLI